MGFVLLGLARGLNAAAALPVHIGGRMAAHGNVGGVIAQSPAESAAAAGWIAELNDQPERAADCYEACLESPEAPLWVLQRSAAIDLATGRDARAGLRYARIQERFAFHPYVALLAEAFGTRVDPAETADEAGDDFPRELRADADLCVIQADQLVRAGRFDQAGACQARAAAAIDMARLFVAARLIGERPGPGLIDQLASLSERADKCLRLMIRRTLATHIHQGLAAHGGRSDLAWYAARTVDLDEAISAQRCDLDRRLAARPNHPELLWRAGQLAAAAGDGSAAAGHHRALLRLQPNHIRGAINLASAMLSTSAGRTGKTAAAALEILRSACRTTPETRMNCYRLGLLYARPERFVERMTDWHRRSSAQPHRGDDVANIAFLMRGMGLMDAKTLQWQDPAETSTLLAA